eukprot:PRCOL_00002500-RA
MAMRRQKQPKSPRSKAPPKAPSRVQRQGAGRAAAGKGQDPTGGSLARTWGAISAPLEPWDVPWGGATVAGGMLGWAGSFLLVGGLAVPAALLAAGVDLRSLPVEDKASYILLLQAAETAAGLLTVYLFVRPSLPFDEGSDLLKFDTSGPLWSLRDGWAGWAVGGYLSSFLVIGAVSEALSAAGEAADSAARGTVDGVLPLVGSGVEPMVCLFLVAAVLAPVLEETVFRGFLLASLTKWMPPGAAIALSSLAFGAAHFAPRDFPQLVALGCVLGFTYTKSRNLATPMLIHGLWNGGVLGLLVVLQALGYDVQELVKQGL